MQIRNIWAPSYSTFGEKDPNAISFQEPGAIQSEKEACDINQIMSKFIATGVLDAANAIQGAFGDFSNVDDYQTSLNKIIAADEAFGQLPAQIRSRFKNDPGQLLQFLDNDDNIEEARSLGLVNPLKPESLNVSPAGQAPITSQNTNTK